MKENHQFKILIIDDETIIRQSFTDHIEDMGYQTLSAENGLIGLEIIEKEKPDLVLTDLRMPEADGLEVIRRGQQIQPDVPIIVVSGAGRIGDAIQALRLGAWDYILKPINDLSILNHHIEKALEKAQLIHENQMYQKNLEKRVQERTAELEQINDYLKTSEERYRTLFERSSDAIFLIDVTTGRYINANFATENLTGYSIEEIKSKTTKELAPSGVMGKLDLIKKPQTPRSFGEVTYQRKDGTERVALLTVLPIQNGETVVGFANDITKRVRADEELKKLGTAIIQSPVTVMVTDARGNIEYVNPKFTKVTGYSLEEVLGKNPKILQGGETSREEYKGLWQTILAGKEWHGIFHNKKKNGELYWEETSISAIHANDGTITHFIALKEDITERKQAEDALQLYIRRLDALRQIDQAITTNLDLKATLNVLLDQLVSQLRVDATAIFSYQKDLQLLSFAQGRGSGIPLLHHTNIPLGEGFTGEVALQRKPNFLPDLNQCPQEDEKSNWLKSEGFFAYFGLPLIAKGALVGVLEVFHHTPLYPDNDWLDYLQAFAGQAAIAIDNAALFNDLQKSNMELALAYDATIEGWSRALEIRDMETEGHSRRVVDLTIKLAKKMGLNGQNLVHIRRGALLHDIGKMGVPDSILQKPGKLTEEEWQTMRLHPTYAYEWLSPIAYLRPALDIPYCHHEHWDGNGYPRGLKREEIPLAARIFAIIDVWDALNSDRPYRPPWPQEKIVNYLREQSGQYFDPTVVDAFLQII